MSDDGVTVVTGKSWGNRLGGSLAGALIGILLFIGSFFLLVWNEGRAVDAILALDTGAGTVVAVAADAVDPANEGRLVHVSATATAAAPLLDPVFGAGGSDLLRLERRVEMYQWREAEETATETSVGGTETTRTTYRYSLGWSDQPIDSSAFRKPEGHANPAMPYRSQVLDARPVRLGAFTLDAAQLQQVDAFEPFVPAGDGALPEGFRRDGGLILRGDPTAPKAGDLRIAFRAVPVQSLSVVARQAGDSLAAYRAANGHVIDLVHIGAVDADSMFRQARADEALLTWILRAVGFVMMLLGVVMMSGPLAWLVSVLPFLSGIVNLAAAVVGVAVAVPLTLLTIGLSWLAFRPLIGGSLVAVAVLLVVAARWLAARRRPVAAGA